RFGAAIPGAPEFGVAAPAGTNGRPAVRQPAQGDKPIVAAQLLPIRAVSLNIRPQAVDRPVAGLSSGPGMTVPGDPEAQLRLGNSFRQRGDLAGAAACYERALRLRPGHVPSGVNLGATLQQLGRLADAVACYEWALSLSPNNPDLNFNLGVALYQSGNL